MNGLRNVATMRQVGAVLALALSVSTLGCKPKKGANTAEGQATAASQTNRPGIVFAPPPPPPPPSNPRPPVAQTGNVYQDRFLQMWTDIHNLNNGYFSQEGIPYHSVETLLVEAPDYGHETTSEAYSYYLWLEAMYGKVTGDWSFLSTAWANMEYYIIPQTKDQPTNSAYPWSRPATYADELDLPTQFPVKQDSSVPIGFDPLARELKQTYNTPDVYLMHWLLDVDNWYGFGNRGDGTSRGSYINTFQRGAEESVWEAITQPSWEAFKWGGPNGFLDIFVAAPRHQKQWKYTSAPDAEARAMQAMYWAKTWADEKGGSPVVNDLLPKASMMGDFLRYTFFDKYFKKVPCYSKTCPGAKDKSSSMYLINWYVAWGGAIPEPGAPMWSWRIGASHNHQGYQNPMAAYALSAFQPMKPKSPTAAQDWAISLQRQLEFYRWLQAADGAIAGGATNSWKGRYETPPDNAPKFYGMPYDWSPVFLDPPSNDWFGFQVWSLQRVAEYYYATGDEKARVIMSKWVKWAMANTTLKNNGDYEIPAVIKWEGQPAKSWDAQHQQWNPADKSFNSTLRATVTARTTDAGTTAGLAHTIMLYAKRSGDEGARVLAKELLDRMWKKYRDDKGVVTKEARRDFKRFNDRMYLPPGYQGKMPNGDLLNEQTTFASMRSKIKKDRDWPKVEAYINGGAPPEFSYHRFWAQAHIAIAYATYAWLWPDDKE